MTDASASVGRRWRGWAVRVVFVLVAVYGIYLVGANLILNTAVLDPVINKRPEKLLVEWQSGWSVVPGTVHVEGFRIRSQSKKVQWECRLDGGTFRLSILGFVRKTVRVRGGRGSGFSFYLRPRLDREGASISDPGYLPEIEGLANPPDPAPEVLYLPRPKKNKPWHIDLAGIRLDGAVDLWLDRLRVAGEGRIRGALDYQLRKALGVPPSIIELRNTAVTIDGKTLVKDVDLTVDATLAPFPPKGTKGLEILGHFAGTVRLDDGIVGDLAVLNAFLAPGGRIHLASGEGRIDVSIATPDPTEAHGEVDLAVPDARFAVGDEEIVADVTVHAALARGDLVAGLFDVEGTTLHLDDVLLPDPKRAARDENDPGDSEIERWWMRMGVRQGTIVIGHPMRVDVAVDLAVNDTRPILRTFFAKPKKKGGGQKIPGWVKMLPNVRELAGDASLDIGPESTVIDDVLLHGDDTDLMARLKVRDKNLVGQLYVRHGILHVGVDLGPDKLKLKLSKPKAWFIAQPEYDDSSGLSGPASESAIVDDPN